MGGFWCSCRVVRGLAGGQPHGAGIQQGAGGRCCNAAKALGKDHDARRKQGRPSTTSRKCIKEVAAQHDAADPPPELLKLDGASAIQVVLV